MITTIESLSREALLLSPRERIALAGFLLDIDPSKGDSTCDQAWEDEIQARIHAIDCGSVSGISHEDVMRDVDRLLG